MMLLTTLGRVKTQKVMTNLSLAKLKIKAMRCRRTLLLKSLPKLSIKKTVTLMLLKTPKKVKLETAETQLSLRTQIRQKNQKSIQLMRQMNLLVSQSKIMSLALRTQATFQARPFKLILLWKMEASQHKSLASFHLPVGGPNKQIKKEKWSKNSIFSGNSRFRTMSRTFTKRLSLC